MNVATFGRMITGGASNLLFGLLFATNQSNRADMLTTVAYAETLRKRMRSDEDAQRKRHKDEVSVGDDSVFDMNDLALVAFTLETLLFPMQ